MADSTDSVSLWKLVVHGWAARLFAAAIVVATLVLGALLLHGFRQPWSDVGTGLLVAIAALASGLLLGFLFGIPRSVQVGAESNVNGERRRVHGSQAVNTNLEQISDWLTKILVGVGLIELARIASLLSGLITEVGTAFGARPDGRIVAGAIIISFGVTGFLLGYIGTRILLTRIFARLDLEDLESIVDARVTEHLDDDAQALRLVIQQLDESEPPPDPDRLHHVLEEASSAGRGQILLLADRIRKESWRDPATQARHDRTVAIFSALTRISPRSKRYWAALGFALKDQAPSDDRGALKALTQAIELRGDPATEGKEYYEFARAIVRLRLLDGGQPDERTRRAIVRDVAVAWRNEEVRERIRRSLRTPADEADAADLENQSLQPYLPAPRGSAAVADDDA